MVNIDHRCDINWQWNPDSSFAEVCVPFSFRSMGRICASLASL